MMGMAIIMDIIKIPIKSSDWPGWSKSGTRARILPIAPILIIPETTEKSRVVIRSGSGNARKKPEEVIAASSWMTKGSREYFPVTRSKTLNIQMMTRVITKGIAKYHSCEHLLSSFTVQTEPVSEAPQMKSATIAFNSV